MKKRRLDGQVRRRLERRQRLGGVQRVDQDVVGAEARRPGGQRAEVGEVADAPRARGPDAVELRREPPAPVVARGVREPQPGRRDDQRAGHLAVVRAGVQRVVAQRQVARHRERRLADPGAVDVARLDPAVDLVQPPPGPVLELDLEPGRVAVDHVHPAGGVLALDRHQAGRHHPPPAVELLVGQRLRRVVERRRPSPRAPPRWSRRTPAPGCPGSRRTQSSRRTRGRARPADRRERSPLDPFRTDQ